MVSLVAENIGLVYPIRNKLALGPRNNILRQSGGMIVERNGKKVIEALKNVSLQLKAGDRLGLVGANGAGKTTLLKVLYGIYKPSTGSVKVDGRVDALFNIRLGFRVTATGRRNIILRGLINGWSLTEINRRMESIIEFSELGDFIDMPMKSYSQGMAARLAFSIATSFTPEVLLMDEWIGTGDPSFQEKSGQRMTELTDKAGIIVLASHNHSLLRGTCTRILELEKGTVKRLVPVEDWDSDK